MQGLLLGGLKGMLIEKLGLGFYTSPHSIHCRNGMA